MVASDVTDVPPLVIGIAGCQVLRFELSDFAAAAKSLALGLAGDAGLPPQAQGLVEDLAGRVGGGLYLALVGRVQSEGAPPPGGPLGVAPGVVPPVVPPPTRQDEDPTPNVGQGPASVCALCGQLGPGVAVGRTCGMPLPTGQICAGTMCAPV